MDNLRRNLLYLHLLDHLFQPVIADGAPAQRGALFTPLVQVVFGGSAPDVEARPLLEQLFAAIGQPGNLSAMLIESQTELLTDHQQVARPVFKLQGR